jgi:hypothetical protein
MNLTGMSPALTWVRVMIEEKTVGFKAEGMFSSHRRLNWGFAVAFVHRALFDEGRGSEYSLVA